MRNITKTHHLETLGKENQKFICRECSKPTLHTVVAAYTEDGVDESKTDYKFFWETVNQIIKCQGCEAISFRVCSTNSEDSYFDDDRQENYPIESVTYYPSRSAGVKAIETYLLPQDVENIYKETVLAVENEQSILAGIGIRALIETICKDLDAKGNNLYEKIDSLKQRAIVTNEGFDALQKLRLLGNNAAHEVKKHTNQQLLLALKIIEHMLDGTYIIPKKVSKGFQ